MDSQMNKKRKARTKSSDIINERKYQCHCGRKYLSYSALYIHSKQKHGVTITTKAYDNRYESQITPKNKYNNQQSKVVVNQKNSSVQNTLIRQIENVERTILYFVNQQGKGNSKQIQFMYWTFEQLIVCINSNTNLLENYTNPVNYTEKKSPAFVPLIFNFFLIDYCPKTLGVIYETNREKMRELIYKFGQWLYENNLTSFEIRHTSTNQI